MIVRTSPGVWCLSQGIAALVVSFTHTYAGEVIDGEHVLAKGKVEKVISEGKKDSYRLVVGTTRESMDEYVKLKESPA